jgi:eukaryotic-like serine/threonine-protein kinase
MSLIPAGTTIARYTILGKLATGGMSELYLARQAGPSGFHKILVLKIILPHLAEDDKFVQMFQNEAKLAALLNHPNVVQVYDFGSDLGIQYLAMEYIDGLSLRRVRERLAENGQRLPIPVACRLTSDVCGALAYAHSLVDSDGQSLQIIHRDVSLENILLTYAGQVKLVDFGLAKARTLISSTTQGTLKGKYRYMAPEMLLGEPVDHRLDIFAVGVVLYSLLVGKMPYDAGTHTELFDQILAGPPPLPRSVMPDLPIELEQVVLRALERQRERRYQSAGELQTELEVFMQHTSTASPYHLGQFMERLYPVGTDKSRLRYQRLAGVVTPGYPATEDDEDNAQTRVALEANGNEASFSDLPTRIADGLGPPPASALGVPRVDGFFVERPTLVGEEPSAAPPAAADDDGPTDRRGEEAKSTSTSRSPTPTSRRSASRQKASPTRPPAAGHADSIEQDSALFRHVHITQAFVVPDRGAIRRRRVLLIATIAVVLVSVAILVALIVWPRSTTTTTSHPDSSRGARDAGGGAQRARDTGLQDRAVATPRAVDARRVLDLAASPDQRRGATAKPDGGRRVVLRKVGRGQLRINVRPWAIVFLDGRRLGSTPLAPIQTTEGNHQLVLENKELKVKRKLKVRVRAGQETVIKIKLGQ